MRWSQHDNLVEEPARPGSDRGMLLSLRWGSDVHAEVLPEPAQTHTIRMHLDGWTQALVFCTAIHGLGADLKTVVQRQGVGLVGGSGFKAHCEQARGLPARYSPGPSCLRPFRSSPHRAGSALRRFLCLRPMKPVRCAAVRDLRAVHRKCAGHNVPACTPDSCGRLTRLPSYGTLTRGPVSDALHLPPGLKLAPNFVIQGGHRNPTEIASLLTL
jgi:hypothetical protein